MYIEPYSLQRDPRSGDAEETITGRAAAPAMSVVQLRTAVERLLQFQPLDSTIGECWLLSQGRFLHSCFNTNSIKRM